jgi:hypothetical protein
VGSGEGANELVYRHSNTRKHRNQNCARKYLLKQRRPLPGERLVVAPAARDDGFTWRVSERARTNTVGDSSAQRLTKNGPLSRRGARFRDGPQTCHAPKGTSHIVLASQVKRQASHITCMRTLRRSSNSLNRLRTTWLPLKNKLSNTQRHTADAAAAASKDLSLLTCIRCAQNVSLGS